MKPEAPIFLETKRLIVRHTTPDMLQDLYGLFSDPEVMRYIGAGNIRTIEQCRENIDKMIAHDQKHGFSLGGVYEKQTGKFIGRAGLVYLEMKDDQPEIEIGYVLHKADWKKGYASELAKAILDWGFKHLPVNKLIAVTYPENEASRRVLEKAGMHYVGPQACYGIQATKYEIYRYSFDAKKLELVPASLEDYPVIQNMGRFYVYDMSEYLGQEALFKLPKDGLYECIDFKKYWEQANAYPFLIRYDNEVAGFAIVDKRGSEPEVDFNMAQFFILRSFKKKGLGRHTAYHLFDKFHGSWEVMVIPGNEGAYRFWSRIIKDYSRGEFREYQREVKLLNNSRKNIFRFESRAKGYSSSHS